MEAGKGACQFNVKTTHYVAGIYGNIIEKRASGLSLHFRKCTPECTGEIVTI